MKMKRIILYCLTAYCLTAMPLFSACNPEDRSGEQPLAPTVRTINAQVIADSCLMTGEVLTSPNSSIVRRGFNYGNDTLRLETVSSDTTFLFQAATRPLQPGRYFMVAYATNGIGTSRGDTLYFTIP